MLKIYGADLSAPANKVRMSANAIGIAYEYIRVKLREGEHRKPEYLAVNPLGKVPAIDDDGFRLFESNAICRYLASKHKSSLYPSSVEQRAIIDAWTDFGTIHVGGALSRLTYNRLFVPVIPGAEVDEKSVEDGIKFLAKYLPSVDEQLGKYKYLCGDQISLADISLVALLDPAEATQTKLSSYSNIVLWRNELKQQDFYTKCHKSYEDVLLQFAAKA